MITKFNLNYKSNPWMDWPSSYWGKILCTAKHAYPPPLPPQKNMIMVNKVLQNQNGFYLIPAFFKKNACCKLTKKNFSLVNSNVIVFTVLYLSNHIFYVFVQFSNRYTILVFGNLFYIKNIRQLSLHLSYIEARAMFFGRFYYSDVYFFAF